MKEKRCLGCMKIKSEETVCVHCGYEEGMQNESHQLSVVTVLKEQYLIGRVLGQGGFGITYLGWDLYLDIPVAIKEYFPDRAVMRESAVSPEVVSYTGTVGERFRSNKERFMREAKMLAKFSDVAEIVQVKNFFMENNTAYIVMEYVDGITLKQYVAAKGGKLTVAETLSLLEPVIDALGKVHKTGLVHRDISPDNIMMLSNGKMKLLDFGAVRDVGDADAEQPLTRSTEAILKQGYAPIEQYQNRGSLGPWTDVYALCATMYFCLTGEVPPDAPERLLGEEEINFKGKIPGLTDAQAAVFRQGMQLRAQKRLPSMDELHQKLYEAVPMAEKEKTEQKVEKSEKKTEKKPVSDKKGGSFKWIAVAGVVILAVLLGMGALGKGGGADVSTGTQTTAENMDWSLEDGVLTITGEGDMPDYNGLWMEDYPEEYREGRDYAPWADQMGEIEYVVLSEGITSVGDNAFIGAENLKEVEWSPALHRIGWNAFHSTGLEHVSLPYTVEEIGYNAFEGCRQLKHVELPYRLSELKVGTFMNCESLENVVIRPYTSVETNAEQDGQIYTPFGYYGENGYELRDFTIHTYQECPANTFAIEYDIYHEYICDGWCGEDVRWAFDTETNTLTLEGNGQTWVYGVAEAELETWREEFPYEWIYCELPDWWYSYQNDIENIVVGDGITHLNATLFADLPNLKHVDLGNVEMIDYLFVDCDSLEEVVLPPTLTHVGACAFENCSNLKKVEILADDAVLFWGVFSGAEHLEEVHFGRNAKPDREDQELGIHENATVYVYKNSEMHKYVQRLGYEFVIVES